MDTAFLIVTGLVSFLAVLAIIKMVSNRLDGKDELDGIFNFKRRKKG